MQKLLTEDGASLPRIPWNSYPRPQMRRGKWLCLNGSWDLCFGGKNRQIRVPFCVESLLSGVEDAPEPGEELVYTRSFTVPDDWRGGRILLHFGAVMRRTVVSVNGREACRHENGYLPFSADITELLTDGENELRVSAVNDLDRRWPWGKQSRRRGGMWYTPCSGIWQTVWLEPVPEEYVRALRIDCEAERVRITAEGVREGSVLLDGRSYPLREGTADIALSDPRYWSPEDPFLYSFELLSGSDRVASYFALRTLTTETFEGIPRLCLNGRPYFFNGLLDQGYWSDGLYTPASPGGFEKDILAMKSLGFNTLRKHIKIEPELFYYACDRLGMIVFQDMVNNGAYRYVRDTVLPTLHFQKRKDERLNPDPETRAIFLQSMKDTVRQLGNHPCICLWTIFNEGWGQFRSDEAYRALREADASRFIDSTSGWYHQKESDVDSLHIYFDELHTGKENRPQLLSEFGGRVWKVPEHSFNLEKTYGYYKFDTREAFIRALRELYADLIPLAEKGLCGSVYTQVSDVEDETNGLFTFDRKVLKVRPEELKDLAEKLCRAVHPREQGTSQA